MIILSEQQAVHGVEEGGWRVVAATVIGAMHERKCELGQDAYAVGVENGLLVAALCDGAGSAVRGLEGARIGSRLVVEELLGHWDTQDALTEEVVQKRVLAAIEKARRVVMRLGNLAEYAATLVGVIATMERGWFFHIGDGAGVALASIGHEAGSVVSRPENGEYINETYFFTGNAWQEHIRITAFDKEKVLALMSDGVTPFAMLHGSIGVDERFVMPVFRYLSDVDPEQGARALLGTLGCESASKISDDDKTLLYLERVALSEA